MQNFHLTFLEFYNKYRDGISLGNVADAQLFSLLIKSFHRIVSQLRVEEKWLLRQQQILIKRFQE